MKLRRVAVFALAAIAVGACHKKKPVEAGPVPMAEDTAAARRAREQARADSLAAAQRAERDRQQREQAAAVARVREALSDIVYFDYDSDQLTSEAQAKLFVPFASTKPSGMGIGLSICRSFVELHQGRLWFSRNPDRGVTFHLNLPLAPATQGA